MAEVKTKRLSQVLREFNISLDRAVEFLSSKGFDVDASPNTKITGEEYEVLFEEFETERRKRLELRVNRLDDERAAAWAGREDENLIGLLAGSEG